MKNRIIKIVLIAFLSIIFVSSLAVSGGNRSGHYNKSRSGWQKKSGHYNKSHSGWYKGKNKGWQSDKPPGMDKKDDQFKQKGKKSEKKQKKAKSKSEMESEFDKHDDELGNEKGKSKKK